VVLQARLEHQVALVRLEQVEHLVLADHRVQVVLQVLQVRQEQVVVLDQVEHQDQVVVQVLLGQVGYQEIGIQQHQLHFLL